MFIAARFASGGKSLMHTVLLSAWGHKNVIEYAPITCNLTLQEIENAFTLLPYSFRQHPLRLVKGIIII